ncbi:iron uptake porin, partial [Tolypothrix sp. VBCCA 56010]|uniref:iron uptake porin n=1 Tax=Tolypothrix sp. VBCCA 56010 TaxID=3137731 RepID=UPI003D7F1011
FLFGVILQTAGILVQYTFWQFLTPISSGFVRNPGKAFNVGLTYARTYQNSAGGVSMFEFTGSSIANNPFGNVATSANHYGVEASFKLTSKLLIGGWYGYTDAEAQNTGTTRFDGNGPTGFNVIANEGDDATFNYWGASLALQDFGRKGNLLGFIFGQPPKTTSNDANIAGGRGLRDSDTS